MHENNAHMPVTSAALMELVPGVTVSSSAADRVCGDAPRCVSGVRPSGVHHQVAALPQGNRHADLQGVGARQRSAAAAAPHPAYPLTCGNTYEEGIHHCSSITIGCGFRTCVVSTESILMVLGIEDSLAVMLLHEMVVASAPALKYTSKSTCNCIC